jgi:two-component system chemotaxis sensor kinase CheA
MNGRDDLGQFLGVFLEETSEILSRMEQSAVALESGDPDAEQLHSLFRGAHTLKGNAASLGFQAMADLAHSLEDVLDLLRAGEASPTPTLTTLVLGAIDALREMAADPEGAAARPIPSHRRLRAKLVRWLRKPREAKGSEAPTPEANPAPPDPSTEAGGPPRPAAPPRTGPRTLRVDVGTLDTLMNLASEITSAWTKLSRACEKLGPAGAEISEILQDSDRLPPDLHDVVIRARLVPLGPTFRQQARTVRDAAARGGKQAQLVLSGEDVLVDTSVVEALREPLVHLVRNALDHGIEKPEVRERAGKAPCGTIALRATRRGGNIVVELADDGAGLDRQAILSHAKAKGLVPADAELDPTDIDRLLFTPGFTTSESVTDLSGRGVGLDVVRRRIEAVRGSVHFESAPGFGTTATLRLPLTVAIIDGYHVLAGGRRYVIPADAVIECRAWTADASATDRGLVERDNHALPCLRLSSALGSTAPPPAREELIVVESDGLAAGLVVDSILGSLPTVIKPLGNAFKSLPALAGFTILGDSDVAPVIDLAGVLATKRPTTLEAEA